MRSILLALFCWFLFIGFLHSQTDIIDNHAIKSDTSIIIQQNDTVRQVDLIDIMSNWFNITNTDAKREKGKIRFTLFPTSSVASGDKVVFTSFNVTFLAGDKKTTNISTIYFIPYLWVGGQYGFMVQPNIWLRNNNWNFVGDYFILNYPQNTWGLGGDSPDENEVLIDYKHLRFHQNALVGIFPHFAIGLGYAFDNHYDISIDSADLSLISPNELVIEDLNSLSSGLTLPIVLDTRYNSLNPQQGVFFSLTYSFYDPIFGSDDRWQSLFIDARKYFPISGKKNTVLAFRSYYWTILSGKAPYLDLPANRWEPASGSATRGISQNRYRSNAIMYYESEYRFGISRNGLWGAVIFASVTAPSQYGTQQFMYWHPAAGAGIRLKFNKYSRTNITLDFGFSKGYKSVYLNIGEAF
jgi:hypothetical protein